MFDGCQKWKDCMDALTRDGLSPEEAAGLQSHLRDCADCRSLFETDALRRDVLGRHTGTLDLPNARSFDDSVIAALRVPVGPEPLPVRGGLRLLLRHLPTDFLQQLAGGTMAAAAVTIICLFSALHPKNTDARQNAAPPQSAHSEPPVALEALLRAHSPRAASLWSTPTAAPRAPRSAPAAPRPRPKDAGRRGSVSAASRLS